MIIQFTRRFSMAHRLIHSSSKKCAVPHGHNEFVIVRLAYIGEKSFGPETNCAADFSELKGDWHRWIDGAVDHAFQLGEGDPMIAYFQEHEPQHLGRLFITPGDPTTELLAALFFAKLSAFLEELKLPFKVREVTVEETPTNSVSVEEGDLELFPRLAEHGWWSRPDSSINDLEGNAVVSLSKRHA